MFLAKEGKTAKGVRWKDQEAGKKGPRKKERSIRR